MDGHEKDIDFGIYDFGPVRTLEDYEKYGDLILRRELVQKYTMDRGLPPNPQLSDEEYDKSFMRIFKHCIDIHKSSLKLDDYNFTVIFENEKGDSLDRKDLQPNEIRGLQTTPDEWVKIWREFNVEEKPHKWIVWPHSEKEGWCEKLEGTL